MPAARIQVVQHNRVVATMALDLSRRAGVVQTLDMLSIEVNAALRSAAEAGAEHGYCNVYLRDAAGRDLDENIEII